ncbi:uncharacterized protein LOC114318775 [Camellia sinensis]|uniref:uncharacterized protein LOC114318775 n=1 Tax=Camellia sinensis TaxID=4442 RepID=UPI0010361F96|nr:uncharacterized protein LOC114318775 [Camellia sinensis]
MANRPPEKEQVRIIVRNLHERLLQKIIVLPLFNFKDLHEIRIQIEDSIRQGIIVEGNEPMRKNVVRGSNANTSGSTTAKCLDIMVRTRAEDGEDSTSARLNRMKTMIMDMTEAFRLQQQQPPPPMAVPPPIVQDHHADDRTIALTKEFKKTKPPSFNEGIDPLKAEAWVFGIEKLFEVFPCTEARKVLLAAFTLKDKARRWWMLIRGEHQRMNWAQFLEIFYEKYFPHSIRDRKVLEFENLKQGNKTVVECEVQKYVNVLDKAIIAEGNQASRNWYSNWKGKRQGSNVHKGSASSQSKKQNLGTSNTLGSTRDSAPTCPECGKKHHGVCYQASGACFNCGKTGHMVRDCPMFRQQKGNRPTASSAGSTLATKTLGRPTTSRDNVRQGRVFALVPGDVQNSDAVVSVTLSINGQPAHVLLDSSSTHSFVSKTFAPNLNRSMERLNYVLCVSLPSGDYMLCVFIYPACELLLGDIPLYANLMPLDMEHFDIILGMDWFCRGYLCSILHAKTTEVGVENIQIVSEFPDVFPKELPRDLIDREIKFVTNIVPGTQPISKAPCRMSLAEMKELKIQLQELLDKGFI